MIPISNTSGIMRSMAAFEHLIQSYEVGDLLDEIASSDEPACLRRCFAEGSAARSLSWPRVRVLRAVGRGSFFATALLTLAACAAPPPKAPLPPPPPPPLDASHDWHVLIIAPFGSVLKEIPATLHEVLLFRDDERSAASADELECYAVDGKLPRFVARNTTEYLLCLKHDRLSRIEATVWVPAEDAVKIFADACGL